MKKKIKEIMLHILRKSRKFIPMPILRTIIHQYFKRYYIRSYSQYGEDLIINDFFKRYFDINGNYLDIGAFHPKMISNTHMLHTIGWKGTIIDLDDFKIELFKRTRKDKVNTLKRIVIPGYSHKKEFCSVYKFNKPFSEIDTLDKKVAEEIASRSALKFIEEKIEAIGINKFRRSRVSCFSQ